MAESMIEQHSKPFLLGALSGAVLISMLGFNLIGWKTTATSDRLVKTQSEAAVSTALANICVVQFKAAKDFDARLVTLKAAERYSRPQLIEKEGFATMPGDKAAISGVSEVCSNILVPESKI